MPRNVFFNIFNTATGAGDDEATYAHMIGLRESLLPLMAQLRPEAVEAVLRPIAEMARHDRQTALAILEPYPAVIKGLLPQGEETLLNVLGLAGECLPYGIGLTVRFLTMSPAILEASDFDTLTRTAALACGIAQVNNRTAEILIDVSAALLSRLGFDGLHAVAMYAAAIARSSWHESLRVLEQAPGQIDRLAAAGADQSIALTVYSLGARMAQDDWNAAIAFMKKSPRITERLAILGGPDLVLQTLERAGQAIPFHARLMEAFLDASTALIERLGITGVEPIRQCVFAIAADKADDAVTLLKKSPAVCEDLLSHFDVPQIGAIYDLGRRLGRHGSSLALAFISAVPELTKRLDAGQTETLAILAEDMAKESLTAVAAFINTAPALVDRTDMAGMGEIAALGILLARTSWEVAARLMTKSPDLMDRIGIDGVKMVGHFSIPLAQESATEAIRLLEKCPQIMDGLLAIGDFSLIEQVCRLGSGVVAYNARLAASLLTQSPAIITLVGLSGLEMLEVLAHEVGRENWTVAVSLLETSPQILERIDLEGLRVIAGLARRLAQDSSYSAVSLMEKTPDLIDRLRPYGDEALVRRIYSLAQALAAAEVKSAMTFLNAAPALLAAVGLAGLEKLVDLILSTPLIKGPIAARFFETAADVIEIIEFGGVETLAGLLAVIAATHPQEAMRLLEKSPSLVQKWRELDDRVRIAQTLYEWTQRVACVSPPVALRLLERSPDLMSAFGHEGFHRIVEIVESQAKEDEAKAMSYLAADDIALTDFMEGIPKGLELKDIQPVLSTYLRALLGRRVELAAADGEAHTDGVRIYLPGRIRDFQERTDNFIRYKVEATHQEGHLEYGTFEFDLEKMAPQTDGIIARYGIIAEADASPMEQFAQLFPEPGLARDLFHLLENCRIEAILKQEYPALGLDILRMNRHRIAKRRPAGKIANPKQRVVAMIDQTLRAQKSFDELTEETRALMKEALKASERLAQAGSDVHTTASLAADLYFRIDEAFKEPYHPVRSSSGALDQERVLRNMGSFSRTARHMQERISGRPSSGGARSPSSVEAPSGSTGETAPVNTPPGQESAQQRHRTGMGQTSFQGPARGGRQTSGDADPDARPAGAMGGPMKYDAPEKIERLLRALHREQGLTPRQIQERFDTLRPGEIYHFLNSLAASLETKTELQSERGTTLYPEWGEDIGAYRANWARIREQSQTGTSLAFFRDTMEKHTGLLKKIRREFQMLRPEGFIRLKRQYDGDDLDLDACMEYILDRKAGLSPPEKNYRLNRKNRRDIACALLIDMSRSTRGGTIEREKEALIMMSEALHEVGDAFAIFGFSGDNRDNVDFYRIKDFDAPYDDGIKKGISAIGDHFENRDGTAIRHASQKLKQRTERTKILILLSDGKPVDKLYSGLYAIEDTRMALKEARRDGVKTFCITVDQSAAEYLPRMYSHSSWTVIDDVAKLPEKITRIYRMLTA
jgi:uncharacterized protein YegL